MIKTRLKNLKTIIEEKNKEIKLHKIQMVKEIKEEISIIYSKLKENNEDLKIYWDTDQEYNDEGGTYTIYRIYVNLNEDIFRYDWGDWEVLDSEKDYEDFKFKEEPFKSIGGLIDILLNNSELLELDNYCGLDEFIK